MLITDEIARKIKGIKLLPIALKVPEKILYANDTLINRIIITIYEKLHLISRPGYLVVLVKALVAKGIGL